MSSIALARKEFNPATIRGSGCMLNSYPVGCGSGTEDDEDYIECERGQSAAKTKRIFGIILAIVFFCIFLLLVSITWHVYSVERSLSSSNVQEMESLTRSALKQSYMFPKSASGVRGSYLF